MKLSWATRITLVRILLIVPFICCLLNINNSELSSNARFGLRYVAVGIYLVMAISDAVDGYLARRLEEITQLGTFLDPVADKLLMTSACLLLTSQRAHIPGFIIPSTVVVLIIGKDLLISIGFIILYVLTSHIIIKPAYTGKIATALQLFMVGAVLIAPEATRCIPEWTGFLQILWWSAGFSAILATLVYIRNGSRYIEAHEKETAHALNPQKKL
jgi:cardiolipin synthase (CMP-forming)